jgi:transcriptional regulator with XRE-family HTH domain
MSKRERLERAGLWLKAAREERGFSTATAFALALGVNQSMVSRYERGSSEVEDERAEQIANVLGMPLVEVRRGLGLWVPADEPASIAVPGALDRTLRQELAELQEDLARLDPSRKVSYRILSQALKGEIEGVQQRLRQLEQLREITANAGETGS